MDVAIGKFGSRSFFQMNGESIEIKDYKISSSKFPAYNFCYCFNKFDSHANTEEISGIKDALCVYTERPMRDYLLPSFRLHSEPFSRQ